jgi:5-methylcytosine-specific restriction endonuclease McrA
MFELNNGKDNSCFYCSESCKETCIKFHKSAVQLQNKIEIASGIREEPLYTSEEYNTWKKEVFRRYEEEFGCIECEYCGNRNIKELSVHHEKPQKTHPHLALDPDNGIIACNQFSEKKCHYKYGHPTGTECSTGNLANKIC